MIFQWGEDFREVVIVMSNLSMGIRESATKAATEAATIKFVMSMHSNCRFSNCTHTTEPRCAVQNAIKNGILQEDRLGWIQFKRNDTSYGM